MAATTLPVSLQAETLVFRIDTGHYLDIIQPTDDDRGDFFGISFDINVTNVDLSTVKAARLTAALYAGGGFYTIPSVPGFLYFNNHQPATPWPILTGVEGTWDTVTFDLDPAWLVSGSNHVHMTVDPVSDVTLACDWAFLTLETAVSAEFASKFTDQAADQDSNGPPDHLLIDVPLQVNQAAAYSCDGILCDSNEIALGYSQVSNTLLAGSQKLTLSFSGSTLHQHAVDGPYYLRNLGLWDTNGTRLAFRTEAHRTAVYAASSFEGVPSPLTVTNLVSEVGITNSSTNYSVLRVQIPVTAPADGNYTVLAHLFDTNNTLIEEALSPASLLAGANAVQVDFSGAKIRTHQGFGPYLIKFVSLYGAAASADTGLAYQTTNFDYRKFEMPILAFTGRFTDTAIDTNVDGANESLRVSVEVFNKNTTDYLLTGRLIDKFGREIAWASAPPVDGNAIYQHRLNAPFYLRDLYVFENRVPDPYSGYANPTRTNYLYDAYTTRAPWLVPNQAPIANAGPNRTVHTDTNIALVLLDGAASSDDDGDPLTFEWRVNGGVYTGVQQLVSLDLGVHTVTLTVADPNDASSTVTNLITVLSNSPPVASPGTNLTFECTGSAITLNGTASSDPDGDALNYQWREGGALLGTNASQPVALSVGSHVITLTVMDPFNVSSTSTNTITITDKTPPQITCPADLLVEFSSETGAVASFTANASDACSSVSVSFVPPSGSQFAIGKTAVQVTATDNSGNSSQCAFNVTVLGALGVQSNVLSELRNLRSGATVKTDRTGLDLVLKRLTNALATINWKDQTHADAKKGAAIFTAQKAVVSQLTALLKNKKSQLPHEPLQKCIDRLSRSGRLLGLVRVRDATKPSTKPTKLTQALAEITKGDTDAKNGKAGTALGHYQSAWTRAASL